MTARPPLTCRELIDFIGAYLEETLAPPQRADFEAHLAICPDCVNYLTSYRDAAQLGVDAYADDALVPESVPEDLVRAVLSARRR